MSTFYTHAFKHAIFDYLSQQKQNQINLYIYRVWLINDLVAIIWCANMAALFPFLGIIAMAMVTESFRLLDEYDYKFKIFS